MNLNIDLINSINSSPFMAYFAITGGGQSFIGDYCSIPGASKTVLGATIPYNQALFDDFVGCKNESYASGIAARRLAVAAFEKAKKANVHEKYLIGIGAASSLATKDERVGRTHRICIAAYTINGTRTEYLEFAQPSTREEEEKIAASVILDILAVSCGLQPDKHYNFPNQINNIKNFTERNPIYFMNDGWYFSTSPVKGGNLVIYPGSWNPIHNGHLEIAKITESILGQKPILELAIKNADKPALDDIEISKRIYGLKISGYDYLISYNRSLFIDKVYGLRGLYKSITFVVGADTWARIWDEKFGATLEQLEWVFDENNVKFLVFGRNNVSIKENRFLIKHDRALNFKMDISSSELRNKNGK